MCSSTGSPRQVGEPARDTVGVGQRDVGQDAPGLGSGHDGSSVGAGAQPTIRQPNRRQHTVGPYEPVPTLPPGRRLRWDAAMTSRRTTFTGSGGVELAGRLELPPGPVAAAAVFAQCFTCGKDSVAAARVSRALAARGIAVLRFDFTGIGGSGGDFASTGFSSNVADLVRAAGHLAATVAPATLLVGHSLGGAAVLAAAAELPEVAAVVTIGAPADPAHVVGLLGGAADAAVRDGEADVVLGGRRFTVRAGLLADLALAHCRDAAALRRPLLVLHSPTDELVGVDNARAIFDAARHPKSFVDLDGADHLLTSRADADSPPRSSRPGRPGTCRRPESSTSRGGHGRRHRHRRRRDAAHRPRGAAPVGARRAAPDRCRSRNALRRAARRARRVHGDDGADVHPAQGLAP